MLVRDLEWFLAVAEHEHVTAAAAALRTSQPTLSRALARLEHELGARLVERLPDGVRLTLAGDVVAAAARDLTERHDQLRADLTTLLDPETGVVRLAFLDSIATSVVPVLLRAFHAHAPRVRVVLRQENAHEIVADLTAGAADLAVTSARPTGALAWHPLQEERLVLVVPPGHRLRGRRRVGLAEVVADELVTTPVGYGYRDLVDSLYREVDAAPEVSFESQDLATIVGLVDAGLGVAIVPDSVAAAAGADGIRLTTSAARRTIGLAWRSDRDLSAPAARFRDFVVAGSAQSVK